MVKRAILVVSFGSRYQETRAKTIDVIEKDIADAFPNYSIYSAYTSKVILQLLKKKDNIDVNSITEVFEKMYNDGIQKVYVQPTFVVNGIEYNKMKQEVEKYQSRFEIVKIGTSLLTSKADYSSVINAFLTDIPKLKDTEAIVLMGHGSDHYSSSIYEELDDMLKSMGNDNIHIATLNTYPKLEDIMNTLKAQKYHKIYLIPFMIVAGRHAKKDMSSDENCSWKVVLENNGFEVECILKGLGENSKIRTVFVEHVKSIINCVY